MKLTILLLLALIIGAASIAGMVAACVGEIANLDALAMIQTGCLAGLIVSCKLVGIAGRYSDRTNPSETSSI